MMDQGTYTTTQTIGYYTDDTDMTFLISEEYYITNTSDDLEELEVLEDIRAVIWTIVWQLLIYKIILSRSIDLHCRSPGHRPRLISVRI